MKQVASLSVCLMAIDKAMLQMWEVFLNGNQTESFWSPDFSETQTSQPIIENLQPSGHQSDGAASPGRLDAEFYCGTECRHRRSCCTWNKLRADNGWDETMDQCSLGWGCVSRNLEGTVCAGKRKCRLYVVEPSSERAIVWPFGPKAESFVCAFNSQVPTATTQDINHTFCNILYNISKIIYEHINFHMSV